MMMTSLCKESVHSFLGLITNTTHMDMDNNKQGLGLATATDDDACRALTPSPPPPPPPTTAVFSLFSKKDPGGIGFIDDMGGGVDGLMSCTESLGFESSDERIDRNQTAEMYAVTNHNQLSSSKIGWRKDHHHRHHHHHVVKKFPPPLSSFTRNGQPSFFLRSVRSDGRLELTEVMTDDRPEILRASRKDGRLRLRLIREDEDNNEDTNEYEQDEETLEPEEQEEDKETLEPEEQEEEEEEEEEEGEEEEEEEEEEEKGVWESELEGLSRCNETIGHQHHHRRHPHHRHDHLHVWSHQCVPTI